MSLFCQHKWKKIAETYQPSRLERAREVGLKSTLVYPDSHESYTTILWECQTEGCGRTKEETLPGKLIK